MLAMIAMPSKIASMTNAIKVQTSITVMRSPPFGVDRPPSDSPIISSLSNPVNPCASFERGDFAPYSTHKFCLFAKTTSRFPSKIKLKSERQEAL